MTVMTRPSVVPYIATWSDEQQLSPDPVLGTGEITFPQGTTPLDRDSGGALWMRRQWRAGSGRPEFGRVHPQRQKRAMRRLLCQVCGEPAEEAGQGCLWLLDDHRSDWAGWPEGLMTTYPPVCLPCARVAVRECPQLSAGHIAVRADSEVCGVYGNRYWADGSPPLQGVVEYDDPAIRWVLASQLVRSLTWCTPVDL